MELLFFFLKVSTEEQAAHGVIGQCYAVSFSGWRSRGGRRLNELFLVYLRAILGSSSGYLRGTFGEREGIMRQWRNADFLVQQVFPGKCHNIYIPWYILILILLVKSANHVAWSGGRFRNCAEDKKI